MTAVINVHEAKTNLSRLLERAHAGEEIILAKAGKPYARLMPLAPDRSGRHPGRVPDLVVGPEFFEPLPAEELEAWGTL
ncbi:MAG: type II toxin-antitoxin system prevent-host-death family antitoxin [bacterium]|nr:type II toxin-antitoxin system prevent-host-death family antitoxin [bacterium]MXV91834.1 type II toxin-antitoxin system Phd/YefM family antitoxin [Acidimicrobiia bacterium]MYC44065.1 type II toxin-antitoxin system Phd/YefM family antitoxin [Acidimicrobiia bacterium]MYI20268.1 type II toxin-antitoxin system Phd/YefM family antitoxin [Acidimicrobiia bacterium]